ncbi:MAG: ABC transporter transmembrane domain-containing protein [Intestinimonas sp.]
MRIGPWGEVAALAAGYVLLGLVALGLSALNSRISTKVNLKIQNEMHGRRVPPLSPGGLERPPGIPLRRSPQPGDRGRRHRGGERVWTAAQPGNPSVPASACLILILWYDPVMAPLALLSAPVTLLFSRALMGRMREHQKRVRGANAQLMAFHEEALQNMQAIKAFDLTGRFTAREGRNRPAGGRPAWTSTAFPILTSSLMSLMGQAVSYTRLAWGVYRLWTGYIDLALMVMFLQARRAALRRVFPPWWGWCPAPSPRPWPPGASWLCWTSPVNRRSPLRWRGGWSEWPPRDGEGAYAAAGPGELPLCAGPSGAGGGLPPGASGELGGPGRASGEGKTTLLRVLLGLIRPQGGTAILQAPGEEDLPVSACTRPLFAYVPAGKRPPFPAPSPRVCACCGRMPTTRCWRRPSGPPAPTNSSAGFLRGIHTPLGNRRAALRGAEPTPLHRPRAAAGRSGPAAG